MGGRILCAALAASLVVACGAQAETKCKLGKLAELPVTVTDGAPLIHVKINGEDATFVATTGATYSFLSPQSAERRHIKTYATPVYAQDFGGRIALSIGTVKAFDLAGIPLKDLEFLVGGQRFPPGVDGLLGENVWRAADVEFDLANGVIRLFKSSGDCTRTSMAYWADGGSVGILDITPADYPGLTDDAHAKINGQSVRVTFNSGGGGSSLNLAAAERAGFRTDGPGVRATSALHGFSGGTAEGWVSPFSVVDLGGEQIKNTELFVNGTKGREPSLSLATDFFLSHRVYISQKPHRAFFTYNGGPVFRVPPRNAVSERGIASDHPVQAPSDASDKVSELLRRGAAAFSRREYELAIQDFTGAAALAPDQPEPYAKRASAHLAAGHPKLAEADFDHALALRAGDPEALFGRGEAHLALRAFDLADADFEAAVLARPTDDAMRLQIAERYVSAAKPNSALRQYEKWFAEHPKSDFQVDALNGRCRARGLANRDLPLALADCDAALRKGRIAEYLDSRGLVLLRMGRYEEAIAAFNDALKRQPKLASSFYGRGLAETAKGMKAQGEADISAAVALRPTIIQTAKLYGLTAEGFAPIAPAPAKSTQ